MTPISSQTTFREIILGRNSVVWENLSRQALLANNVVHAISHRDLTTFEFTSLDRVWVLSYSRLVSENAAMLKQLQQSGVAQIVYLSSSSTCVARITSCYEYPRVKLLAETAVRKLPIGRVLTVGLMYTDAIELPAGLNVGTSFEQLAAFILNPSWSDGEGQCKNLLFPIQRPFFGAKEKILYVCYGKAIGLCGRFPCLLRPIDLLLRSFGMRWYGYVFLSNRIWTSTIL
jgi:hypothetical protein